VRFCTLLVALLIGLGSFHYAEARNRSEQRSHASTHHSRKAKKYKAGKYKAHKYKAKKAKWRVKNRQI
jgi:uncharacterized protein with FMN-binding domain